MRRWIQLGLGFSSIIVITSGLILLSQRREIRILAREGAIEPQILSYISKQCRSQIKITTYQGNPSEALATGTYDLILHLKGELDENQLSPIDHNQLPNLKNLEPLPNEARGIPYLWGSTGVAGREKTLFGHQNLRVGILNDGQAVMIAAAIHLGLDPRLAKEQEIEQIKTFLIQELKKPNYQIHNSQNNQNLLLKGELDIAQLYSLHKTPNFSTNPKGESRWTEQFGIPEGQTNNPYCFLNTILEPKVGARTSNYTGLETPNTAARIFLRKKKSTPVISPAKEAQTIHTIWQEILKAVNP